jgi:diguanylate cyclase (GGDEF)-like protein
VARAERERSHRCAVLFLDLNRFKLVNDSFSHAIGDELLIALAGRLAAAIRPADTVARLGGDEFTILLDDIACDADADAVAQRALAAIERPVSIDGHELFITASVGISLSEPGMGPSELMRNADIAMYDAKRQGKPRMKMFNAAMHRRVVSQLQVETDLRSAIDDRLLRVFYQPIIDLRTGKISGLEALARWPAGQPAIPPDQFIAVAEETGLIGRLGRLVLGEACGRLSDWRRRNVVDPTVTVSVNTSRWQLGEPRLIADVLDALKNTGLPAHALRLEITESTMITDPDRMRASLDELERIGVHTHIDDFGTGHSSLTVLQHFPGDTLKIDRSFIATVHEDEGSAAIVRATIALAKNLNLRTTAEGVENHAQLQRLVALGCDYAQGYLFSRPLDANGAENLIRAWTPFPTGLDGPRPVPEHEGETLWIPGYTATERLAELHRGEATPH